MRRVFASLRGRSVASYVRLVRVRSFGGVKRGRLLNLPVKVRIALRDRRPERVGRGTGVGDYLTFYRLSRLGRYVSVNGNAVRIRYGGLFRLDGLAVRCRGGHRCPACSARLCGTIFRRRLDKASALCVSGDSLRVTSSTYRCGSKDNVGMLHVRTLRGLLARHMRSMAGRHGTDGGAGNLVRGLGIVTISIFSDQRSDFLMSSRIVPAFNGDRRRDRWRHRRGGPVERIGARDCAARGGTGCGSRYGSGCVGGHGLFRLRAMNGVGG